MVRRVGQAAVAEDGVTPAPKASQREFRMHAALLWDVIHRQAGEPAKAILEGVMNCVDAGSTKCEITFTPDRIVIVDDGKGFVDNSEIEKFFETFGTPHDDGDATYGRFRMGRGQLFAFGANRWASNTFRMNVDLKPQKVQGQRSTASEDAYKLGYQFIEGEKPVKGCRIEVDLYEPMHDWRYNHTLERLKKLVAYVQIPVTINGKRVNVLPHQDEEKWDLVTEDAYYRFSAKGGFSIYNLGVLVDEMSASRFGTGGVVVSRRALDVNFARNNIIDTCPTWRRIRRTIDQHVKEKIAGTTKIDDAARERMARDLLAGEVSFVQVEKQRLLTDVTGSRHPMTVLDWGGRRSYDGKICVVEQGDRVAEAAHTRGMVFAMAKETLARFDVKSAEELLKRLQKAASFPINKGGNHAHYFQSITQRWKVVDRDEFKKVIKADYVTIQDKEMKPAERMALEVIQRGSYAMAYAISEMARRTPERLPQQLSHLIPKLREYGGAGRSIHIGVSDVAMGWTDGHSNIWVHRNLVGGVHKGFQGMLKVGALLLHEYLHDEPDTETHEHGVEFYEAFERLSVETDILGECVHQMMQKYMQQLEMQAKKPTGVFKGQVERIDAIRRAASIVDLPEVDHRIAPAEAGDEHEKNLEDAPGLSM